MRKLLYLLLTAVSLSISLSSYSQTKSPTLFKPAIAGYDEVLIKLFPLLYALETDQGCKNLLQANKKLLALAERRQQAMVDSLRKWPAPALSLTGTLKFTKEDIDTAAFELSSLFQQQSIIRDRWKKLQLNGYYRRFDSLPAVEQFIQAWRQDADGINYCIAVYGENKAPHYPLIDSMQLPNKGRAFTSMINTMLYGLSAELTDHPLFFSLSMAGACRLLELDDRLQAGDFEPMANTVNKAAIRKAASINWNNFPYTLILVPGAGPDQPGISLSAEAKLRLRLGADQYWQQQAPFIMVSGGKVHPYKTAFNEAEQMRRYLVETLQVPGDAILMEPHARHTTTNLRNCARLIYKYHLPAQKACLAVTSRMQSQMITETLAARCQRELNLIPFRVGKRLSDTTAEFYPLPIAMQIEPTEPMDP